MTQPALLLIDSVRKRFGAAEVLAGISLTIAPGEIFGLIGLNGVGKTTLIKIILDLLKKDSGTVAIGGVDHLQATSRAGLFYLPEKFMPSPMLTGHEYLALSAAFHRQSYRKSEGEEWAAKLDLAPAALRQTIRRYSKGMGQKLGLISALQSNAPLLLLDEPMSGLDPKARAYLKRALKAYCSEGRSIFFSSHILADMDEICQRIGVLHQGQLRFTGTPEEFKHRHQREGLSLEEAFLELIEAA